ncbi:MAG: glycosyltransferase [Flavobacteriales bacterium]|mgnify:CR=1 FL=1|nr:glycosyltransferase [Flavobacteriales bacterium]|tara:strand:+ start:76049 stop:76744 length:696 start_codon:yes stop_codon:yes gene_type:complete
MHKILSDNLSNNNKRLTTFLNLYSYMIARNNKAVFKEFNILIDGIIFVWILKLFGFSRVRRNSFDMTSLAPIVFKAAIENNNSIYFIGSKPKVIDTAIKKIKAKFSNLNICGYRDGYLNENERDSIFNDIISLKADIVVCGMGTPLQEQFLLGLQQSGFKGRGYTCGGFLHQTANNISYYPNWVDRFNLRGFYRMYDEPYLIKRYFILYPWSLIKYLIDSYEYNKEKKRSS